MSGSNLSIAKVSPAEMPDFIFDVLQQASGPRKHHFQDDPNNPMFTDGRRDNDLFNLAYTLAKGGMGPETNFEILKQIATSWGEGNQTGWLKAKVESAYKRASGRGILPDKKSTPDQASIESISLRLLERISRNAKVERIGLKTGFRFIDSTIYGLVEGWLYVIGAYTSVGKTALLIQLVINCLKYNRKAKIVIFSTEMSDQQIVLRLLACLTSIPSLKIFHGRLPKSDAELISDTDQDLKKSEIYIFDSVYTFDGILDLASQINPDLVFVDYLQNMMADGNIFERMSRIPIQLQDLAKRLDTAVVALSQVSNEAAKGESRIMGYKGAGEIAAACDFGVWLERDRDNKRLVNCFVRKNRHGMTCKTTLEFSENFTSLRETF